MQPHASSATATCRTSREFTHSQLFIDGGCRLYLNILHHLIVDATTTWLSDNNAFSLFIGLRTSPQGKPSWFPLHIGTRHRQAIEESFGFHYTLAPRRRKGFRRHSHYCFLVQISKPNIDISNPTIHQLRLR
jgi:hypothetical protein